MEFIRSEAGLATLIGLRRADGAALMNFMWAFPPKPLKQLIAETPTLGEVWRRERAAKGGQH